jgi:hypothetical protein
LTIYLFDLFFSVCIAADIIVMLDMKTHADHHLNLLEDVLQIVGLTISSIFTIEFTFKILFTLKELWHSKLEIFDSCIIVVGFVLDVLFFTRFFILFHASYIAYM